MNESTAKAMFEWMKCYWFSMPNILPIDIESAQLLYPYLGDKQRDFLDKVISKYLKS